MLLRRSSTSTPPRCPVPSEKITMFRAIRLSVGAHDASNHDGKIANIRRQRLGLEMLGELQALRLVVRADALAIQRFGTRQHGLIDEPADDLPVFEDERHFARAHLEQCAAALPASARITETRIEDARIEH